MSDYRNKFIKSVEESLVGVLSDVQLEIVTDEITKALKNYDLVEAEHAIIEYSGINEATLKRFCACMMIEGKSEKTIEQYKRTAEKLIMSVKKNYSDMNVYDIRLFMAYEKQRGVSNRTLENTRANLSAFFQWMTQEELINKNPCMNISPIKYTDKVRMPFSSVEIDALRLACKNEKERAIIELLLSSGVRVSELTNIKTCDIDFNNLSIHITKGKGAKERTAYINELAKTHISKYIMNRGVVGEYLFYNKKKQPLNPGGVRHLLKELGKRANVDNVHPHRFRRTFASGMASRGMELQEIKKLLGHSDINTTLTYVYTSDDKTQISYKRYSA